MSTILNPSDIYLPKDYGVYSSGDVTQVTKSNTISLVNWISKKITDTVITFGELSYETTAPIVSSVMEFDVSGNASWKATTPLSGSGAPAVAPRYNGDRYFDYTNSKWYMA